MTNRMASSAPSPEDAIVCRKVVSWSTPAAASDAGARSAPNSSQARAKPTGSGESPRTESTFSDSRRIVAESATKSTSSRPRRPSINSAYIARICGSKGATRPDVNALAGNRRRRACSGASVSIR
jgi:hypothetical protein